jgi:hypothetical protein
MYKLREESNMYKILVAFLVALAVVPAAASKAAASDKRDVMATVNQFNDSLNKGDTKTALAACAAPSSIIDEFPPHQWQGATACADWANDFATYNKKYGITHPFAKLGTALTSSFPQPTPTSKMERGLRNPVPP